jgi:ribosome-associated heat shock protein Hsp15
VTTVKSVRIDKWLWAIRIFKTRTLASDACKAGRVKVDGQRVKASRGVKVGETVHVQKGQEKKVVKAVILIEKRVGAAIAVTCYEDFSPPPPPKIKSIDSLFHLAPVAQRRRGDGRPTKKERRAIDKFKND